MDKKKRAVIMVLDFFEIINGFKEHVKAHEPGQE